MAYILILTIFILGYAAIIFEHYLKVNKTAVALFMAVSCWAVFFVTHETPIQEDMHHFHFHVSNISQIIFFLLGAMTIVELVDSHRGFRVITNMIKTTSKKQMAWWISIVAFFLSAVLDNLTTTILMVSLLRKLVHDTKDRFLLAILIVVAANAGGAWTPIGDVTTTMLWINNQITTTAVMKSLFLPSVVSMIIPLLWLTRYLEGKFPKQEVSDTLKEEPGARLIFTLGIAGLVFVPIFKAWTGLPPFMGVLISLSVLWLVTDFLHHKDEVRHHLRVPHVLTRIDTSGALFFLGILLCVSALETAKILPDLATWLSAKVNNLGAIATLIGIFSAIVDNVPLVAATMGMYPLDQFPTDHTLWMMIAYAAGTGGSIFIIGSAAGVALMGMEKVDFVSYMKKASLPVLVGYLAGMGVYLAL